MNQKIKEYFINKVFKKIKISVEFFSKHLNKIIVTILKIK